MAIRTRRELRISIVSSRVRRAAGSRLCVQVLQSYEMLARDMPMQGTPRSGYIHATDWYATFLTLAGLSAAEIANDARAAAAHLPAIDSINLLSFLFNCTSTSQSPRTEIPLDCTIQGESALIVGDFKLLQGPVISATWSAQLSPNKSAGPIAAVFKRYTAQCSSGCLKFSAPADSQRADALRFRRAGKGNGSAGHPNASKRRAELNGVARGLQYRGWGSACCPWISFVGHASGRPPLESTAAARPIRVEAQS